ncbi:hypothetical protein GUJ93_ZPchr0010g7756 [Zizania palustris]|uniref:Uncharacterized protein n=1 Tax=Zizania palustris TaxID=103762 RepID=A0A8J5W9N6_ZIZPA|nr:hypothetical protein GUJ93_ZPchr0010g7756 [Zizania palustris]
MASSHAIVAAIIISLLLLASSSQSLVHAAARMMPSDRPVQVPVARAITDHTAASSSTSRDLLQEFMAPPRPQTEIAGKPEISGASWRRRVIQVQVQGSVPSPGIGHH